MFRGVRENEEGCAGASCGGMWMVCALVLVRGVVWAMGVVLVREMEGPPIGIVIPPSGQPVTPVCPPGSPLTAEGASIPENSSMTSRIVPRITSVMSPWIETPSGRTRRWLLTSAVIRDGSCCSKNARNSLTIAEPGSGS